METDSTDKFVALLNLFLGTATMVLKVPSLLKNRISIIVIIKKITFGTSDWEQTYRACYFTMKLTTFNMFSCFYIPQQNQYHTGSGLFGQQLSAKPLIFTTTQ